MDHSGCVDAGIHTVDAHTHEGQRGFWLFPSEAAQHPDLARHTEFVNDPQPPEEASRVDRLLWMGRRLQDPGREVTPELRHLLQLALGALQEKNTEIAQLKAQLDAIKGHTVLHCMERDIERILGDGSVAAEADGTILRATDTGRELELRGGTWLPR